LQVSQTSQEKDRYLHQGLNFAGDIFGTPMPYTERQRADFDLAFFGNLSMNIEIID
jgi:hypothetical protein